MNRDNTPWQPLTAARLDWTERGDPRSLSFDDIYYSRDDGLAESHHVFLQGNDLPGRWQSGGNGLFCVAETGFGTGLNFLACWRAWLQSPLPRPRLHYLSVEKFPLAPPDLARALSAWPELAPLASQLLERYPGLLPGQHRLLLERGQVTLDLWWEDVEDALADLAGRGQRWVDAWFLDGFAPARNAAMWQENVLDAVAALSRPGATFATFTAVGKIRRHLARAGFQVEKVAGYGRKRECLRGRLQEPADTPAPPADTPWDLPARPLSPPGQALVLGAGLAGCFTAAALARRGIEVTLLERNTLASAGSGNEQGILYTRLSRKHSALVDFSLQSYRYSTDTYRDLFAMAGLTSGRDGALCGSFHQSDSDGDLDWFTHALAAVPELARVMEPAQALELLGIDQPSAGYWFPRSGWLNPAAVCAVLADHPRIRLVENCGSLQLAREANDWCASNGEQSWSAPCAIVAAGTGSAGISQLEWLPLQVIRGQTTRLPSSEPFDQLRGALCHGGYIAPARAGVHCIGATFGPGDEDPAPRAGDNRTNLASLARAVPAWRDALAALDPTTLDSRVGFRCASPDYLPLVGPAPDVPAFLRTFGALRANARQRLPARGDYLPGLYLNTAHGSRGLTSTPLAAELLASQICGEPPPLGRQLGRALAPARFIIRDLSRNRM